MLLISVLESQRQADLRVQGLVYVESSVWNRTGEMTSQFRALVPEEVLGSFLASMWCHTAIHHSIFRGPDTLF